MSLVPIPEQVTSNLEHQVMCQVEETALTRMASAMSFLGAAFTAQLLLVSLLRQPLVIAADDHMGQVTIHARLIDWECWNRMRRGEATVDGSDIMLSPQDHKAGCLQVAVCKALSSWVFGGMGRLEMLASYPQQSQCGYLLELLFSLKAWAAQVGPPGKEQE